MIYSRDLLYMNTTIPFNPNIPSLLEDIAMDLNFAHADYMNALIKARTELAELKGYSHSAPNPLLLISPAVIREAVASSRIEHIQTTVENVLKGQLYQGVEQNEPDKEVLMYGRAIQWAASEMKTIPISTRLILGIHKRLMPENSPGFRKIQNSIVNQKTGKVVYTPPIASRIPKLMQGLEKFIHSNTPHIDPLIKCALLHYQFESIHPFSDGNGRVGRMLMVLYLIQENILTIPILFISGYINRNRSEYYKLLNEVSTKKKWKEFVLYMLKGFYLQAKETKDNLFKIMDYYNELREKIKFRHKKIYSTELLDTLFNYPVISPVRMGIQMKIHYTTATRYLDELTRGKILQEEFVGKYHLYFNRKLVSIMNENLIELN